jgi:zinc protease
MRDSSNRDWTGVALRRRLTASCFLAVLCLAALPLTAFDLAQARQFRLGNGLTLVVLEEPSRPVVSVQMLYRAGARDEQLGRTGLAHFLEHMAFRASENFPDTDVVSSIYAVGGEWHGYTWLDQTTYFETMPAEHLDLALKIEADRMARLLIPEEEVEAERGAVLTEMHGYENDPKAVLKDAVLAISFLQHPYRNNSIGWESDVARITHADLVEFYRRTYCPANAVLAVVGQVETTRVLERVRSLFGDLPGGARTPLPHTVEPPQKGVRRIEILGAGDRHHFEIAYRAPSVTDPDYPAFLVTQQVLAGGRGINFRQNEFGDAVLPGSRLHGITDDLVSWYPPQAAPYVFTVAGSIDAADSASTLEEKLQEAIDSLLSRPPTVDELVDSQRQLLDELVFDLETTEDAAHQLAYFVGLDALDVLLEMPARLTSVGVDDVSRIARTYLRPHQRTIGWYLAGRTPEMPAADAPVGESPAPPHAAAVAASEYEPAPDAATPPRILHLENGLPVIFQRTTLSSSAYLRVLVPTTGFDFNAATVLNSPVWRHTSLNARFRPSALEATLRHSRNAVLTATPAPKGVEAGDPAARLDQAFDEALAIGSPTLHVAPSAIALVGDLNEKDVLPALETHLGDLAPAAAELHPPQKGPDARQIDLAVGEAQAQLGYVVTAPPPSDPDWFAWRILLYVLSHGYEGRLGVEAISRRGLVYYIDSRYVTDGESGRITLAIGVDPAKLPAMQELFRETLQGLADRPPTETEVAEARAHLRGRRLSAAQSNSEISAALLEEWVGRGRLLSDDEFVTSVNNVTWQDVARIIPAFLSGTTIVVRGTE